MRNKGFTLLEILIVVAIVGTLTAISIYFLGSFKATTDAILLGEA